MKHLMNQHKALVLIAGGYAMGGAERRFLRSYRLLAEKDAHIHLIINRPLYEYACEMGELRPEWGCIHVLPSCKQLPLRQWRLLYWLLYAVSLVALCLRYNLRVLHLVMTGVFVGLPALMLPGMRGIISVVQSNFSVYSRLSRPLYALAVRLATRIDVLSPSIRQRMVESDIAFPGLAGKIVVSVCSFTDYSRFRPAASKQDWVVYASRFEPIKSPLVMVDVACQIVEQHATAQVFILGFGSMEAAIHERLAEHGTPERVIVRFESDVASVLAQARVFLSLQNVENYPSQAVLEAMACECAIIASDVGDTKLFVDDKVGGRVPLEADAIAARVTALLADPKRCAALGQAARERATEQHTIERYTDYLLDLYQAVLQCPGHSKTDSAQQD